MTCKKHANEPMPSLGAWCCEAMRLRALIREGNAGAEAKDAEIARLQAEVAHLQDERTRRNEELAVSYGFELLQQEIAQISRDRSATSEELAGLVARIEQMGAQGSCDLDMFQTELKSAKAIIKEPHLAYEEAREWQAESTRLRAALEDAHGLLREIHAYPDPVGSGEFYCETDSIDWVSRRRAALAGGGEGE